MRRLFPQTFFAQLVLSTLVAQTLVLGSYLTFAVVSTRDAARKTLETRISRQIDRLATACTARIEQGDTESLRDLLEMAEIAPSIQSTRLTDLQGNTIAFSKGATRSELDSEERRVLPKVTRQLIFRAHNGQVEAVTPLLERGTPTALLWLEASGQNGTTKTVARFALTYGALALLANLLPIFLIVRRMTQPIRMLSEATHRVLRGVQHDPEFPLPVTAHNEAGVLTQNFNTMVEELEHQRSGLLETLALLDSMLGNAPVGFAFIDRDQQFVRRNDFFSSMFPHSMVDGGREAAGPFDDVISNARMVFESGEAIRNIEIAAMEGQRSRTWLMQFYPVRTSGETVRWVGVVASEITDRLRAEEVLRRTEKLAAAGRLAASVAHEINNPLESVTNLLYILRNYRPMDTQALGYIESAQAELSRVAAVTQQTLRFYRQSVSRSRTDMEEITNSVLSLYHARLVNSRITVVRQTFGDTALYCFSGEMRQLLANLVANAIDAMSGGGTLTVRTRRTKGLGGVQLTVADTGCGMSESTVGKIFEAFFTTKPATGTGLGLWVSAEIIEKHGGTVKVRSRRGVGSCFTIFFPDPALPEEPVPADVATPALGA